MTRAFLFSWKDFRLSGQRDGKMGKVKRRQAVGMDAIRYKGENLYVGIYTKSMLYIILYEKFLKSVDG